MNHSELRRLTVSINDRVATITFNNPDAMNAVDGIMHAELTRVFPALENDPEVDVMILTGAGDSFCAGGDLKWMQESVDEPWRFEQVVREAKQIVFAMLDCEKPIIAKVNGHAVGLGASLALFCDMVIASTRAKIGDPHVKAGLVAADGGAVIWPQLIGYARAKEYLMTGSLISAEDAAKIGLINHAVAPEELDDAVNALVARLRSVSRKAMQWTKVTINIGLKQLAHSMMDAGLAYEVVTNASPDHAEAVAAFREGRKPVFRD